MQDWANRHGQQPSANEWHKAGPDHPANATIAFLFGSWNNAIEAAGFTPRPSWSPWAQDTIVDACRGFYRLHGRPPTQKDWTGASTLRPTVPVVRHRFGSWNAMIRASHLSDIEIPTTLPSAALADVVRPHITGESQRQLAERAGITERALYRILSGETERTTKRIADRLLVAIDRPDAWHIELAEYAA